MDREVKRSAARTFFVAVALMVAFECGRSRGHVDGYAEGFMKGNETRRVQRSAYRDEAGYLQALKQMNEERR